MRIYTREGCDYCDKLKLVLDSFKIKYKQYKLDEDFNRSTFYSMFSESSTFPQVMIDGVSIGGYTETIEYLTAIGCLQEEKDMECVV